jgi:hypothetical protein
MPAHSELEAPPALAGLATQRGRSDGQPGLHHRGTHFRRRGESDHSDDAQILESALYFASLLAYSTSSRDLLRQLPWLVTAIVCIIVDNLVRTAKPSCSGEQRMTHACRQGPSGSSTALGRLQSCTSLRPRRVPHPPSCSRAAAHRGCRPPRFWRRPLRHPLRVPASPMRSHHTLWRRSTPRRPPSALPPSSATPRPGYRSRPTAPSTATSPPARRAPCNLQRPTRPGRRSASITLLRRRRGWRGRHRGSGCSPSSLSSTAVAATPGA